MKRFTLLTLSTLAFVACASIVPEEELKQESLEANGPTEVRVEILEEESATAVENGVYTNTELGVRFELVEAWPEPEYLGQGYNVWLVEDLGAQALWRLGLGGLVEGACEGTDCYRTSLEAWENLDLELVRERGPEVLVDVISEERVGNYTVMHTSAGGICGSLMSYITDGENSFIYQADCVVNWDSENQVYVIADGVMDKLQTVVSSLELL